MAARHTVFNLYLFKMAWVLWEEFSGKERLNQSGKRLKDRTRSLSDIIQEVPLRKRVFLTESTGSVKRQTDLYSVGFRTRKSLPRRALVPIPINFPVVEIGAILVSFWKSNSRQG
jgi:hypothetical protein